MVCLKAKTQKNQTPPIKPKHAKTTTKKSNLKPQSLSRKKGLLKTWRIRGALLASFMSMKDFKQPFIGLEHAKLNQQHLNQTLNIKN